LTEILSVWVNCPSPDVAARIAAEALRQRLAASANIHAQITSTYRWQGSIETRPEVPLMLRTQAGLFDDLARLVEALHPYQTPGIVGVAAERVSPPYRDWVAAETADG